MPKLRTEDYTRIALLADTPIVNWWNKHKNDPERQERLRKATQIGLDVLEGNLVTFPPDKAEIYKAIETLLRSGVFPTPETKEKEQSIGSKKPKIGKIRDSITSQRK